MDITFTGVWVRSAREVFLTSILDEHADESPDHCLVLRYFDGVFQQLMLDHAVISVAFDPENVSFIGPDGTVTVVGNAGRRVESVDASDDGPSSLVNIRAAISIGSDLFVCGMARLVYRRRAGRWDRVDAGLFVPRDQRKTAVGLHAIAGRSAADLLVVGQFGEIWRFDGHGWTQEVSPTNVALTRVSLTGLDGAVIAGLAGTVLRGRPGSWEVVEHGATTEDFWGSTWFRDELYLSNYAGVYRLENSELTRVGFEFDEATTTAYLDSRDGHIWSVGHKDIAISEDGRAWRRIPNPVADR